MYKQYKAFKPQPKISREPTPSDIEGPFYKAGAPEIASGVIGLPEQFGDLILQVSGQVADIDNTPIVGASLDIWQADKNGIYDNNGFKLRGKIKSDDKGVYKFETIMPGDYQIDDNPPDFRCAHIHVKVNADGFKPLTTQLYFPNDKYNSTDHWFDPRRVIQTPIGKFDFILTK